MKKVSTAAARQTKNFRDHKLLTTGSLRTLPIPLPRQRKTKENREGSRWSVHSGRGLGRFVPDCALDLFSNFRSNLVDVVNRTCVRGCLLQNVLFSFTFCHEPAVKPNIPTTHGFRHHSTSLARNHGRIPHREPWVTGKPEVKFSTLASRRLYSLRIGRPGQ